MPKKIDAELGLSLTADPRLLWRHLAGLRGTVSLGARWTMHAGSGARVLLAWADPAAAEAELVGAMFTDKTLQEVSHRGRAGARRGIRVRPGARRGQGAHRRGRVWPPAVTVGR